MPSITNVSLSANFSIGAKNSSGDFVVSGTIYNNASSSRLRCRLSISLDNSSWSHIGNVTIAGGGSYSGSVTISSGNTSSQTVYVYLLYGTDQPGVGGPYTVEGYVDPTPPFGKKILSISPTTVTMGGTISISESSGEGVSSTTRRWSGGGSSGSFSLGSWNVPISTFEPLCPNAQYLNTTFTTYSSGEGGSGSSSVNVRMNVPSNYAPTCTHYYEFLPAGAAALVGGVNSLKVTLSPSMLPADNSASVSSVVLQSVTTTNSAITTNTFTKNGDEFTSSILPTMSGVPSYTFSLTFRITDTRGRTFDYTTNTFRVTNFVPPIVSIDSLTRNSGTTGTLNLSIISPSAKNFATVKVGDGEAVDVLNQLVATQDGYTLTYNISGLNSGNQYNVTFSYQDTNMYNYGESPYSYTQILSTMSMPISLYDNGSRMAVSFGEECADNYGEDVVINYAKDSYVRVASGSNIVTKKAYDALTYEYTLPAASTSTLGGIKVEVDGTKLYISTT